MSKITQTFIKDKYDLDKERRDIEVSLSKGTLDLVFDEPLTKQEFREFVDSALGHYPDDILFQYQVGEWDNQDEIVAVERVMLPESNDEVIYRLMAKERKIQVKNDELQAAQKLLEDNDYNVSKGK